MSSAHWYELRLKKGETLIELTADDPTFMDGQLRHWFDLLSVPGLPTYPVAPPPTAPVPTVPMPLPPEIPVGLAQRLEFHQSKTHLPEAPAQLPEVAPPPVADQPQPTVAAEPKAQRPEQSPLQSQAQPPAQPAAESVAGFSRPSLSVPAPRFVDAPTVDADDMTGDPELDELLALDKISDTANDELAVLPQQGQQPLTDASKAPRPSLPSLGGIASGLTADELLAMELDAKPLDKPDIVIGQPKSMPPLDEESARVLDELMASSPVSGDLPTNADAQALRSQSISDRNQDPELDDEDFERVMSTLMADLQGSALDEGMDNDMDQALEDSQYEEYDSDDGDDEMEIPPAAWAEAAPIPSQKSEMSQSLWHDDERGGDTPTLLPEEGAMSDWDQIDLPLGSAKDPDGEATQTPEAQTPSPWAPISLPDPDLAEKHYLGSEVLADEMDAADEPEQSWAEVSPKVTAADVAPAVAAAQTSDEPAYEVFLRVCDTTGAATSEDHLLISAYVLTVNARQERFSLGALNHIITQAGESAVNHSILEVALNKGLLMMVPDLTGTAETAEFELTPHGRATVDTFL